MNKKRNTHNKRKMNKKRNTHKKRKTNKTIIGLDKSKLY